MTTNEQNASADFANELRESVVAIELNIQTVGRRRSLAERQQGEVAQHFGAQRRAVGTSKSLYAPNQPEIKRISAVLAEARETWQTMTIGYRRGVRLLRKDMLPAWQAKFTALQAKLDQALAAADEHYYDIIDASCAFLGEQLFNLSDYPQTFAGSVAISWGVFNFEPSDELLRLAPDTYQREQQRVRRQFEDAIAAFEDEAREQLKILVNALLEKLAAAANGQKVKFTEAATNNLREFFTRFDALGIRSDAQLTQLVETAKQALGGTTMAQLKGSRFGQQDMAAKFTAIAGTLDKLIIEAPTRAIDIEDLD
jgi:hypothetical protein